MNKRIVIDTNVIISALIGKSYPHKILNEIVFDDKVIVLLSEEILIEYREVILRDKFKKYPEFQRQSQNILNFLERIGKLLNPDIVIDKIKDVSDNKFLELAVYGKAKYLITGNINDFTFQQFEAVKIIEPKEFYELWL